MKFRNPVYVPFALLVAILLGLADHNGWSAVQSLASRTWQRFYPSTQHK
jgi:hypothetical protein